MTVEMPPSSSSTEAFSRSRKRAAAACHACHARKVRCSISQTGVPCTNCSLDNVDCQARPRQPQSSLMDALYRPRRAARPRRGQNLPRTPSDAGSVVQDGASLDEHIYRPFIGHFDHHSQAQEASTANPQAQVACSPVYGDIQGVALVADLCEPERPGKSGHFVVNALSSTSIDSETLGYLKKRGCFDLPAFDVQQTLVEAYFHYVHPFFPVVHTASFLKAFESPEQNGVSLHLLWSIFLSASNFADVTIVQAAGYESRKDMKRAMFSRSKVRIAFIQLMVNSNRYLEALYDADHERSKVALIQVVLLMGFWYADTEDRLGPWHWNGIAISLCQTVGLHRQPDASVNNRPYSSSIDQNLWKHLWWSCFFRETWLSVGMGRPMRINLAHSDTPKPDFNASKSLYSGLTESQRRRYIPEDSNDLFLLWDELLSVTSILSRVLAVQHLAKRTLPTPLEVDNLEREIRGHCEHLHHLKARATHHVLTLHMHHFELFFESTLLTLFRPFLLQSLSDQLVDSNDERSPDWLSSIRRKATTAAMNTNNVLGEMITSDTIRLSQSLICIALIPTLQVHLLHSVSRQGLVRRLGCHQLDLCMMVVNEIKMTYFGAEILYRLFSRAREMINSRSHTSELITPSGRDSIHVAISDDQDEHVEETPGSALPVTWSFNTVNSYGLGTDASDEYENADVNAILSQCMFPDFATIEAMGLAGTPHL
ncbi:hypothetical protein LB507_005561 [Fusarium sp. FIESC RH6]|nr:hypothetical protein LB507_005561 [Fusarium sp. FIESC RH6]